MVSERFESDQRGVSDVVGVAILVSLSIVGALALVAVGGMALNAISDQAQHDLADDSLRNVDSRLGTLADSPVDATTAFTFPQGTGSKVQANASAGKVVVRAETSGQYYGQTVENAQSASNESVCTATQPLGTIVHDKGETGKLVYQGGGLWRVSPGRTTVESAPKFDYSNNSIDFSFISIGNLRSISQGEELTASINTTRAATNEMREALSDCWTLANASGTVPVEITVTVHSEYADGWERYATTGMTQPLGEDGDPNTVVRRPSTNEVVISFGTVGNTSGVLTDPSDFPPRIIYAGLSQWAQYNDDISPHDGGPEFTVDAGKHALAFYYEEEGRWVYSKNGNSQWKYANGDPVQGPISQVGTSGNPTVYDFETDSAICVINRTGTNMGNPQIRQKLASGDCTETMAGITSPSRISVNNTQSNTQNKTEGGLDYDDSENVIEVESKKGTLSLLTAQIGEARTLTENESIRRPMDVEFVLDRSGSMGYTYEVYADHGTYTVSEGRIWEVDGTHYYPGESVEVGDCYETWWGGTECSGEAVLIYTGSDPLGQRIDATKSFIDALNSSAGDTVGAIEFNTGTRVLHRPSADFEAVKDALVARSDGGTRIDRGLERGIDQLIDHGTNDKQAIVLLTDGRNDGGPSREVLDELTMDQAQRAARNNITIHTVGLGEDADEGLLQEIAQETDGTYTDVDNANELEEKFEKIAKETKTTRRRVIQRDTTRVAAVADNRVTLDLGGVNDPNRFNTSGSSPVRQVVSGLQNESLAFRMTVYGCDEWTATNVTVTRNGNTYTQTSCAEVSNSRTVIDNDDVSDHIVITQSNGNDLSDIDGTSWWQPNPAGLAAIDPYLDGNDLDLGDNEAIVALEVDRGSRTGYVLLHFGVTTTTKKVRADVDVSNMTANVADGSADPMDIDISEIDIEG